MSLQRIYSSKLYVTSTRKDRIHAAIQDPLNIELVQQVSDYLDDDSKNELKKAISEKQSDSRDNNSEDASTPEGNVFEGMDAPDMGGNSSFNAPPPRHSSSGGMSNMGDMGDMPDMDIPSDSADLNDAPPSDNASNDAPEPSQDIEQATDVVADDGIEVNSSESETPVIQSGIIKKLLNDQEDTNGVVRVDPTDDEVWIYYEDKINLNDVMDNVITTIKDTYNTLKFSRLARTDNAVVFDIKE